MNTQVTAETVKSTREKYGLSQRAFAALLGIGEATIVRYEQGAQPTRANANLILAADDPHFMRGCFERYGDALTARQHMRAQEYIYAFVELPPEKATGNEVAKMDEIYAFTLRQEVLNEKAAGIVAEIMNYMIREHIEFDSDEPITVLLKQLLRVKVEIIGIENRDGGKLERIAGYLDYIGEYAHEVIDMRGVA